MVSFKNFILQYVKLVIYLWYTKEKKIYNKIICITYSEFKRFF